MSAERAPFSRAPEQIRLGADSAATYVRSHGFYAVHDRTPGSPAPGAIEQMNDGAVAVYPGDPGEAPSRQQGRVGPVYTLGPGGAPVVPTGLLFIRFAEGVAAESRRPDLERSGYEFVKSPGYAPHAAWVRSRSNDIAQALAGMATLESLPDVERVEPELLLPRGRRGS
jgi:hypothetical protein